MLRLLKPTKPQTAKPGSGKSVLCTYIIEDLGDYVLDTNSEATHETYSVVFYFFDKRRETANAPSDAIRAMLTQLVHLHRLNNRAIDLASIIFAPSVVTGEAATDIEAFALLELLLDQLKFTYLVFDGLDECSDCEKLFTRLRQIASRSQTSAILFLGRPSVQLPIDMRKGYPPILLRPEEYYEDIALFLKPQLSTLVQEKLDADERDADEQDPEDQDPEKSGSGELDSGSLGIDIDKTVSEIVQRANGMFLWVKLLLKYLWLPSLTTQDLTDAVENLNRLQGLDTIYQAILTKLEAKFLGSLTNIRRLFQFVAYSQGQLELGELHHAISVPLDRAQTKKDLILGFKKSIGSLSGSLLELSRDQTVQFIHLSAQEYFIEASASEKLSFAPKILINRELANRNIAAICLSYLVNTVPAEPLGGSSQTTPNREFIRRKYRLLKYAAEHWDGYFADAFLTSLGGKAFLQAGDASWSQLARLIKNFLDQGDKVTTWIEASWLEGTPPRIHKLPELNSIRSILKDAQDDASQLLETAVADLGELAQDLKILQLSWSYILKGEPNEIWEPSIPSFTPSRFWLRNTNARVVRAPLSQSYSEEESIVIRSQVARNGTEIGVVKLILPK